MTLCQSKVRISGSCTNHCQLDPILNPWSCVLVGFLENFWKLEIDYIYIYKDIANAGNMYVNKISLKYKRSIKHMKYQTIMLYDCII